MARPRPARLRRHAALRAHLQRRTARRRRNPGRRSPRRPDAHPLVRKSGRDRFRRKPFSRGRGLSRRLRPVRPGRPALGFRPLRPYERPGPVPHGRGGGRHRLLPDQQHVPRLGPVRPRPGRSSPGPARHRHRYRRRHHPLDAPHARRGLPDLPAQGSQSRSLPGASSRHRGGRSGDGDRRSRRRPPARPGGRFRPPRTRRPPLCSPAAAPGLRFTTGCSPCRYSATTAPSPPPICEAAAHQVWADRHAFGQRSWSARATPSPSRFCSTKSQSTILPSTVSAKSARALR